MRAKADEQRALIKLMDRQYGEIREIESRWHIFGSHGDYRARIEHYHDAVRALSNGERAESKDSRLSAERIAYDVAMLRLITAKPTVAGRGENLSPQTGVAVSAKAPPLDPDRETRADLKKLYRDYTVLFVALLAEKVDHNAETRTEEANALVADCRAAKDALAKFAKGQASPQQLMAGVEQIEQDALRRALKQSLAGAAPQPDEVRAAIGKLNAAQKEADAEIGRIDQAVDRFSTDRLAIYEDSRETVKAMAGQGLNVAGKFVESAMRQAGGQGRGY